MVSHHDSSSVVDATRARLYSLLNAADEELQLDSRIVFRNKQLMLRLSTYKDRCWPLKPCQLSPLICASHGWFNDSLNTLLCTDCGALVVCNVRLGSTSDTIVQKYVGLLQSTHKDSCTWRIYAIPEHEYRFPLIGYTQTLFAFYKRRDSLVGVVADLAITLQSVDVQENIESVLHDIAQLNNDSTTDCLQHRKHSQFPSSCTAFQMALFGWEYVASKSEKPATGINTVQCAICLRECGVWQFANTLNSQPSRSPFDVIMEHRWFCPWITAAGSQQKPGWKITVDKITSRLPR
ncbi:hypothetical protein BATDEDRAFT_24671 [Batrachochytrium dendrobatidis JAM81]|uniref:C3HC-type domain-containing protein n=2 Tax=Batrachochytrium dendrobatidis TaxID=109871 RepID=F4P225_BATDJ|nr:uncharacterized protein BATDEDRAFT_24671 [Batrachochytrium dendrobatidis JAM81]EGF81040.1 hypothetical protein BATDEDRAFT_24671 [Batrachochytrium dendrobatidis JAM81]KAK5668998.1 hypothetical protein QVD99_004768 [Batrachochytrium dendrobatidis]OAJ41921.1 hypothetical protein BDEG_25450 [Batrachochytrium dendrobatidis JEL423]|eukprot:XP_006678513.1 hypothetical protein BATDEDRAFT_24671 [Batrachochytrium dendrobatidis JAM81]